MRSNLEQVRQQKLANFCQVILLDLDGHVVESCNSIFDASPFLENPVHEWFPFIESVFPALPFLKIGEPELLYSKVENPATFLPGYYDFSFSKIEVEKVEYILWELFDYTTLYRDFRLYQQKRNELEIQRQIFALENKKLRSKEEILERKANTSSEGAMERTSFDKKKVTPFNALDMAVNVIQSFPNVNNNENYIDSLDSISSHMQGILDELPEREIDLSVNQSGQEREFSLENLLYDSIPYISADNINIMEASVAEELPNRLFGNPLDLKRIIVGLALNVSKCYKECSLRLNLYLQDMTNDKCIVGIKIVAIDGEAKNPDMMDILLRLAIMKRIVELHQGNLEMETSSQFDSKTICHIPYLRC